MSGEGAVALLTERTPASAALRSPLVIAGGAGALAALVVLWLIGNVAAAAGFLAAALVAGGAILAWRAARPARAAIVADADWNTARALAQASADAVGLTDRDGRLVCANDRYAALWGGYLAPPALPLSGDGASALAEAGRTAWRDGVAHLTGLVTNGRRVDAEVCRTGSQRDMLVWRFAPTSESRSTSALIAELPAALGDRLGLAGVMAALIEPDGHVLAANRALIARATGAADGQLLGEDLGRFLSEEADGSLRFVAEGADAEPLRLIDVPFLPGEEDARLVALLDTPAAPPGGSATDAASLVQLLPFGVALVDREGRFMQMNPAFGRIAGVDPAHPPLFPGDLVVREDKAAVSNAVRRFTGGAAQSVDVQVRLREHAEELVTLSIGTARGLGDAAVLLSFKDNGEESRLKREVAQATKMQAVGQLAGGVAHDFNNILTAIIGYCDLMLMRHSPGDSDYDDIQQIRANSNRAASLTRQLLAFSRQQTLRPQVLQLPDIVSEVSNLLKRLIGETVILEVKHGRDLGAVRADPGQLEQVVVNLAVNARDAMLAAGRTPKGGNRLTIVTRTVPIAEIRQRGTDIMPLGSYTALEIADTGTGIPPDALPKIFEPFFTTKEVGKGTGLGLSTVYGIVKQSGGYIFADSRPGKGATFTIYLPVHADPAGAAAPVAAPARAAASPRSADTWGTGTVLLVEDEAMVRAVAERALVRQGYTVLTAENGEAALEQMDGADRPDLIVSDVMMPEMDGPTMARTLRRTWPTVPILFMSGYAEEQLRRSIDLDHVAFLPKPFSVQQLAEATRDLLAASGVAGSEATRRQDAVA